VGGFPDEIEEQLKNADWASESCGLRLKMVGRTVKDDIGMTQVWLFCFVKNCSLNSIPAIEHVEGELFLWDFGGITPSGRKLFVDLFPGVAEQWKDFWYDPVLPNAEKRFFLRLPFAWEELGKYRLNVHRRVHFRPDGNYNAGELPKVFGTLHASFSFDNTKAMPPEGLTVPEEKKFEDLPSWLPMP